MPRNIDLAWKRLKESILETKPQDLVKFVVLAVCLVLVYVQVIIIIVFFLLSLPINNFL